MVAVDFIDSHRGIATKLAMALIDGIVPRVTNIHSSGERYSGRRLWQLNVDAVRFLSLNKIPNRVLFL